MTEPVSRRRALAILGLAGMGVGGYVVHEEGYLSVEGFMPGDQKGGEPAGTATATPAEATYQALQQEIARRREQAPEPEPRVRFDYEHVDVEGVENAPFSAVSGETNSEGTGDTLEITVGDRPAENVAAMLRAVWYVEPESEVSATVSGTQVQFTGGEREEYAVLLGVDTAASPKRVLAGRGQTMEIAEKMIEQFD